MTHRVITRKIVRNILVDATDEELLACGQSAAEVSKKLGELELEKKEAMDSFKEAIKADESKLNSLLDEIRQRKITVMNAACVEEWDSNEGKYRLVWNGRLVEEREMNIEERQKHVDNLFNMAYQKAAKARAEETPMDIKQLISEETSTKTKKDMLK
jgi:polyhydroxyalkanoate synthesis regulator phasin